MQEENLDYRSIEGIVDVGCLIPSCFENPLKEDSISFVHDVLVGTRPSLLPVSVIIGTYHIVTNYLGVPRVSAKSILAELLRSGSKALYHEVTPDLASLALDYSVAHNIESWDGYLLALAKKFDATKIFSLDLELGKSLEKENLILQNPFKPERVKQYHRFLEARRFR